MVVAYFNNPNYVLVVRLKQYWNSIENQQFKVKGGLEHDKYETKLTV